MGVVLTMHTKFNRIFISHASEDAECCEKLASALDEGGARTWFSGRDLLAGQHWLTEIEGVIRSSRYFLALMSRHSVRKSGIIQKEMKEAIKILDQQPPDTIYLLPVRIEDVEPAHESLMELQWIDLFKDWERAVTDILTAVRAGKTSVLLVDDHELVRSALGGMINREGDFEVAGEASDAGEAMSIALACRPDVIITDIDMPGMICFDALRRVKAELPDTKIIFLSAFFHDHYIEQALSIGAQAYVVKGDPPKILFDALKEVAAGGTYFSQEVRSRFALTDDGHPVVSEQTVASTLTNRETEVLRYLARGLSKKEIAETMHLSFETVEHHSTSVMRKLDIHDRVELARYAIREGLAEA